MNYVPRTALMKLVQATRVLSYLTDLIKHNVIKALFSYFSCTNLSVISGIVSFSGLFFSKKLAHPAWFLIIISGSSLKAATGASLKQCFEKAIMFNQAFSEIKEN